MKKINIGSNIKIYWKIWRGANKVTEDFNSMNTNLKVFLVGAGDTYYLEPSINNTIEPGYDVIELDIPAFRLDAGVYNIKAIWEKNGGRNVLTSARASVLYLTDSPTEAPMQDEDVRIVSLVENFGRDGMSAYETAVMRGLNIGFASEKEWVQHFSQHIVDEVAEAERKDSESIRVESENTRVESENTRVDNENTRVENEAARAENEAARTKNEVARTEAEDRRISRESDRELKESTRNMNEDIRQSNEILREKRVPRLRFSENNLLEVTYNKGESWEALSEPFDTKLFIDNYVDTRQELPETAPNGTICAVKHEEFSEDNPKYDLYVYNTTRGWVYNGVFGSVQAGVVQTTGTSEDVVMSQKAVSDMFAMTNIQHLNKIEDHYINSEGDIKKDVNFDLFEYDITAAKKVSLYIATGGGYAIFKNEIGSVVGTLQTEGQNKYVSKWVNTFIPSGATRLYATQAKSNLHEEAGQLRVFVDACQQNLVGEEYLSTDIGVLLLSPLSTISYNVTSTSLDITFNSSEYSIFDEYNNRIFIEVDKGLKFSLNNFERLYIDIKEKKIIKTVDSYDASKKYALIAYVENGVIVNGLLANHFASITHTTINEEINDLKISVSKRPINGSLKSINPSEVKNNILYRADGTEFYIENFQSSIYDVQKGAMIKFVVNTMYGTSGLVHLATVDSTGFHPLVTSTTEVGTEFYIIADEETRLVSSGGVLSTIEQDVVTYKDISVEGSDVYGANTNYSSELTEKQLWFTESPMPYEGKINAINIPKDGVDESLIYIAIGERIDEDTIKVVYVSEQYVSTGKNSLSEPISFKKGYYIGIVTIDRIITYTKGFGDHCFAGRQGITTLNVGELAVKSSTISRITYSIGYDVVYYKDVNSRLEEVEKSLEDLSTTRYGFLKGKKVLFIGDSITDTGHYVNSIKEKTGCVVYNRGWSGTTVARIPNESRSMCDRLDLSADDSNGHYGGLPSSADYVFVLGGVNDWGLQKNQVIGDPYDAIDATTFCGALKYLYRGLKQRYPNAKIYILNLLHTYSPEKFPAWSEITYEDSDETKAMIVAKNNSGKTFADYREAIRSIAAMYGLSVIDLYDVGFSAILESDREKYYTDGLHPNEIGGEIMADYILKHL